MNKLRKGLLVVLSSPSGGGKTTIFHAILKKHPNYSYSISTTTRPPRANEKNGMDYHFISEKQFLEKIKKGEFVEWAFVHGYRYGTLKTTVQEAFERESIILFDLDVQGAESMKKAFPIDAVNIFILPPTPVELEKRLRARKSDSDKVIEQRLKNAEEEIKRTPHYDYVVINDELEWAVSQVDFIIEAELCRPRRILPLPEWKLPYRETDN